jgi:endo-1,4-beta-mannosidase
MARFLTGVNYWPRRSAMGMWSEFDPLEIDEDFARIAALGLDVVRFFLLWEDFQPAPDTVAEDALLCLETVLERAAAHKLRTMPTLFCGHMSGVNWLPAWTLDRQTRAQRFRTISSNYVTRYGIGDFYTGELLDAQRLLARTLGKRLRAHPAILAWDLGNEFSNLREPTSPQAAAHWSATLTADLLETSAIAVTGGLHGEDIMRDRCIRLSSIAAPWEFATMHGYSVYSDFARDRLDPEVVPFLSEVTASCTRKPVLFSEFGNPTCPGGNLEGFKGMDCLTEDEMCVYARNVLERLHARGALGAFWWCWADYDRALRNAPPFDEAPHELHFGLIRNDGSEKPIAQTLAAFAREGREVLPPRAPIVDEAAYFSGFPDSVDDAYAHYLDVRAVKA